MHLQEIHFLSGPLIFLVLRKALRRRVVLTVHNVQPHKVRRVTWTWFHRFWTLLTLRQADALIVHSEALRESLVSRYPPATVNAHVVPHGVRRLDPASEATRAPAAVPDGGRNSGRTHALHLLFYGTIRPNKGLHHLLDAFASAPVDWQLSVAGSPVGEEAYFHREIEPRVERLRNAGRPLLTRFEFVPEHEVGQWFGQADFLVLPYTDFNAQSGVLFDAIAWRVPIICTPAGALSQTVSDAGIGEVAESAAPEALARAIMRALHRDRHAMLAALAVAAESGSWASAGDMTRAIYRSLRPPTTSDEGPGRSRADGTRVPGPSATVRGSASKAQRPNKSW